MFRKNSQIFTIKISDVIKVPDQRIFDEMFYSLNPRNFRQTINSKNSVCYKTYLHDLLILFCFPAVIFYLTMKKESDKL